MSRTAEAEVSHGLRTNVSMLSRGKTLFLNTSSVLAKNGANPSMSRPGNEAKPKDLVLTGKSRQKTASRLRETLRPGPFLCFSEHLLPQRQSSLWLRFCRQTSLKTSQIMRPFAGQAKGVQELVVHGLNDLPQTCQPATQGFGPAKPFTGLMRRSEQIDLVQRGPLPSGSFASKAFIGHIRAQSRQPSSATINIRGESYRLREKRKAGVFHDFTACARCSLC